MTRLITAAMLTFLAACSPAGRDGREAIGQTVWHMDNLDAIGGHPLRVLGAPRVIRTPSGAALEFDGVDDAVFLDTHPLAGLKSFTVEVVFQPYPGGEKEQRFFHMQEDGTDTRVMFETRLTDDGRWFLDTFIRSGEGNHTMYAEEHKHPIGPWYHAAIVVGNGRFSHYVNGALELTKEIEFEPQKPGRTSLGVRINEVYWYKGAIRTTRFTPRVLSPEEFLKL